MRHSIATALTGACLAATGLIAGCGEDRAVPDPSLATTADQATQDAYRLTVRSSQGATDGIRASLCGDPSSRLVELPCGVSLGFARVSAPRLYVGRRGDRLYLELQKPAAAIFTSLAQGIGDRGLMRESALIRLGRGKRATIGLDQEDAHYPTVAQPTYLSVLVVYDGDMPVPSPVASGAPKDAVVRNASAEFLIQLATRAKADQP